MNKKFTEINKKEFHLFSKSPKELTINVWTLFWIVMFILILSGLSVTVRDWIFISAEFAQAWYNGIDEILDVLGAPKLP